MTAQRQGRPQEPAGADGPRLGTTGAEHVAPSTADRSRPRRRCWPRPSGVRAGVGRPPTSSTTSGANSLLLATVLRAGSGGTPTCRRCRCRSVPHPTIRQLARGARHRPRQRPEGPAPAAPPADAAAVEHGALRRLRRPAGPPVEHHRGGRTRCCWWWGCGGRRTPATWSGCTSVRWCSALATFGLAAAWCRSPAKWLLVGRLEAGGDPAVGPALPPVLVRQEPDPDQPTGPARGLAALRAVPARARREDGMPGGRASRPRCPPARTC